MATYFGRNRGTVYSLGKELSHGGEGIVYAIDGRENYVAKVYKTERITNANTRAELRLKIEAMLDMQFSPYAENKLIVAWPVDLLFTSTGVFSGFVMPRVVGKKSLIWATRESDRNILFENQYTWKKSVAIAYNLSMVIEILHRAGIVVGDMNPNNILIDKTGNVTLIDADSFNITTKSGRVYKCSVGMEEVLPAELQGKDLSDPSSKFCERTDCFSLAIHIFNLLCNNCHPFGCLNFNSPKGSSAKSPRIQNIAEGYCPYVSGGAGVTVETAPDMNMLPQSIRVLFERVFKYSVTTAVKTETINARPTAKEWRQGLYGLYSSPMKTCKKNAQHVYPAHYSVGCPWCAIETRRNKGTARTQIVTPQPPPVTKANTQQTTRVNTATKPPIKPPVPNPPKPHKGVKRFFTFVTCMLLLLWLVNPGIFEQIGEYFTSIVNEQQRPTNGVNETSVINVSSGSTYVSVRPGQITRVKFVAPSSGTYLFTTTGSSDTMGYLYNSSSPSASSIYQDDDNGSNSNFLIEYPMTANQTVYVGVKFYNASESGNVNLSITKKSTTGSTTSSSSILAVRSGQNTIPIRRGEITRVKFTAPSAGTYIFATNGTDDTVGYLYNSAASTSSIWDNDNWEGDSDFHIEHTLSGNQTIYIGVKYFSSDASGTVNLVISKKNSSSTTTSKWPVGETCRVNSSRANANVRSGPGTGYSDVGDVFSGDTFVILESRLGDTGKDWYKIRHNGQNCWISSGIVTVGGFSNGTINGVPIR